MKPEEYLDLVIRVIVAFLIPLGWAVIFYPFMRKFKKTWPILLAIAILFSVASLIAMELAEEVMPVFEKISVYMFGIFLGTAALSFLFNFKNKRLAVRPEAVPPAVKPEHPKFAMPLKHIHLRHLLQVAVLAEERSKEFYDKFAKKVTDSKVKDLCYFLAQEELRHKEFIEKMLYAWLPLPPNREVIAAIEREMGRWDILTTPPDIYVTEEVMARYAIAQEMKMADFYLSFEGLFPEAWRRMNIQILVMAERSHANRLINAYPQFYETGR